MHYCTFTLAQNYCSPISNDGIARARPNMNIKVAAYIMAYSHFNIYIYIYLDPTYTVNVTILEQFNLLLGMFRSFSL